MWPPGTITLSWGNMHSVVSDNNLILAVKLDSCTRTRRRKSTKELPFPHVCPSTTPYATSRPWLATRLFLQPMTSLKCKFRGAMRNLHNITLQYQCVELLVVTFLIIFDSSVCVIIRLTGIVAALHILMHYLGICRI